MQRSCVWFAFGRTQLAVEVWSANLDTPYFTVDAYIDNKRKLLLSVSKNSIYEARRFLAKASAVVLLDEHPNTLAFARSANCSVFKGNDALYWAFREILLP